MNIVGEEDEQQCNNMNRKIQKIQNHKSTTPPCHLCGAETTMVPPPLHLAVVVGCRFESQRSSLFLCRRNSRSDPQNLTTVGVGGGNTEAGKRAHRGREEDEETWRQRKTLEEDATEEDGYGNFEK